MSWEMMALIVVGLCLFEIISSLDNAVVNADILVTMSEKGRKWFLLWGIIFAVFVVRGLLPTVIVWMATPGLGPVEAIKATFQGDAAAAHAVKEAAPLLLCGGGVFLLLLFLDWLFREEKAYGVWGEAFLLRQATWFYLIASVALTVITWHAVHHNPMLAFSAMVGSTAFFLSHGFKEHAEKVEEELKTSKSNRSDLSKILYLEIIDLCFSIDGVVGAFAFTMSVPLILLGNGIGAVVVRQVTVALVKRQLEKRKQNGSSDKAFQNLPYLKNGAMYAIGTLAAVMIMDSFHIHVPMWFTPVATMSIIGFFLGMCFWRPVVSETEGEKADEPVGEFLNV